MRQEFFIICIIASLISTATNSIGLGGIVILVLTSTLLALDNHKVGGRHE